MADNDPKDLDFDELHEAVNALMSQTQKGSPKPAKDDTKSDDKPAGPPPKKQDDPADDDNKVQVSVKRPAAAPTTTATVRPHRGSHGRAMDVVGPREKPELTPPSARARREGATLQPTQDVKPEEIAPTIVPERAPLPEASEQGGSNDLNEALASLDKHESAMDTGSTLTHQKSEMPDPLDVMGGSDKNDEPQQESDSSDAAADTDTEATNTDAPAEQPEAEEHPAPTVEPAEDEPANQLDRQESDSPFVTTKVEKRPLGAYSNVAAEPAEAEPEDSSQASTDTSPGAPEEDAPSPLPPQPQPEEFNPAVVAVESAELEDVSAEVPEAEDLPEEPAPQPAEEPQQPEQQEPENTDLRSMQIPQQYQAAEATSGDAPRPVFDTKEYHPAIEAHTGGSAHHGALGAWLMAIVLLALLIAVLGAVYYFITGGLDFSALL